MSDKPQAKWNILGHEKILNLLESSLRQRRLAQVYLFTGPKMIGKMAVATRLANFLICENYNDLFDGDKLKLNTLGCGECPSCRAFQKGLYADYYLLERGVSEEKGNKQMIKVEQVRNLLERLGNHSFSNGYKVIIVPEAEYLSDGASNSLLKFLEEPTPKTVIILISTSIDSMLPTVISRSQLVKFLPIGKEKVYDDLVKKGVDRNRARTISAVTAGRPTLAENLNTDMEFYQAYEEQIQSCLPLLQTKNWERVKALETLTAKDFNRDEALRKLEIISHLTRDYYVLMTGNESHVNNVNLMSDIKNFLPLPQNWFWKLAQSREYLEQNVNPKFVFENLFLT